MSTASRGESSTGHRSGGSVVRKRSNAGSSRQDERMIGQWRIGRTIGKGSSGRVKIAKHAITGKYAAIKIVPKGQIISSRLSVSEAGARADKVLLGIEREIVIMKLIDHPNVLNLYDVWETSSELYLIMEYVPGGELFDYLVKRGRLPVSEALHYFQQIIHAVDYCHRFNICHRDLKPENLLLDRDKNIKVADFGMAAWEAGERMLETSCGSPHYASPEIVAGKAYHGSSSDIWSCGIILFALLTGRLPFDDDNIRSLLQKVKTGIFEMPDEIKNPARDLLAKMLEKDPERRITMPEILRHPFFVSRSPRPIPGRALVSPPSLDEVERPVNSPEEIDEDIMGNLKTLWSGASDDEIIAALMSKDKTWEKAIYHLLVKYRSKHLENYNMDESEDEATRQRRAARKAQAHMFAPNVASPPRRQGSTNTTGPRKQPLGENETLQETVEEQDVSTPIKRPNAPTPKKASTQPTYESPIPSRPQSMLTPRPPIGPRAPSSQRGTGAESPLPGKAPAIVLQEATPTKEMQPPTVIPSRPGSALASPSLGTDANLPPLNVPQVNDEQLQHFFNEVAAQLNTMNIRSSVVSTGSSASSNILGSDYHTYLSYINGGPTTAALAINEEEALDINQFADADDDETEAASVHSMAMSAMSPISQHAPLAGLGLGGPPISHGARPQLYPAPANTNRWSYASSASSARGASVGSYPSESPQLYSPAISWAEPVTPAIATLVPSPVNTRPANPLPTPPGHLQAQRAAPLPPRTASRAPPPQPVDVALANARRSGELQRDGSYMIITHADTPSVEYASQSSRQSSSSSRAQDAFGMLVKKKKKVSIDPVAYSPSLAGPSSAMSSGSAQSGASYGNGVASPKRSWFGNLFSFKPAAVTVNSHQNIGASRELARKVLGELGVRSTTVEIDGMRALKCRFDDVVGANGSVTVKGVRFRVEFARASSPSATGSFGTSISLTQEKGAQSSFQHIFQSLKTSFEDPLSGSAPYRAASYSAPGAAAVTRRPVPQHTHSYPVPSGGSTANTGYLSPAHSPRAGYSYAPTTSPTNSMFKPGQQTLQAPSATVQWATPGSPQPATPMVPSTARFAPAPLSPQPPRSPRVPVPIRS